MRRLCQDRGFETGGGAPLWLTHVFGSGLEHDEAELCAHPLAAEVMQRCILNCIASSDIRSGLYEQFRHAEAVG